LSLLVDNIDEHSKALDSIFSGITLDKLEKLSHLKEVVIYTPSEGYFDDRPNEAGSDRNGHEAHETISEDGQDHSVRSCGVHLNTGGTTDLDEQSTSYSTRQQWRKDLESLGSSVEVILVRAPGRNVEPYFMRNFCARYGMEIR
jgi:hypothetical protein